MESLLNSFPSGASPSASLSVPAAETGEKESKRSPGAMRPLAAEAPLARPLYLRLSVTERCNLHCLYCRPGKGDDSGGEENPALSDGEILSLLAQVKASLPVHKIRLTGGDPLVRPGLPRLVGKIRMLLPHAELALTTNGLLLSKQAVALKENGLDSMNVSLDTLDEERFEAVSGVGGLSNVIGGIRAARAAGFEKIKLNTVLLRSVNGDRLPDLARFANDAGCELRMIELMPIGVASGQFGKEFFPAEEALSSLRSEFGEPVPLGSGGTSTRYLFPAGGRNILIGVIPTISAPFCDGCDRLRIDSRGWLYPCLHDYQGVDLMELSRRESPEKVREWIRRVHDEKKRPVLDWTSRTMIRIGG